MKEEEQKEEEAAAKLAFSSALVSRWRCANAAAVSNRQAAKFIHSNLLRASGHASSPSVVKFPTSLDRIEGSSPLRRIYLR